MFARFTNPVPGEDHRPNIAPPYYFVDLPKSALKLILCDKPRRIPGAYQCLIQIVDKFCVSALRKKQARNLSFTSVILSEIAHVSDEPIEPHHMLVKLTLPTDTGIARAITAHIYLSGTIPDAVFDYSSIYWNDIEDIAEHEIWATREATRLPVDMS